MSTEKGRVESFSNQRRAQNAVTGTEPGEGDRGRRWRGTSGGQGRRKAGKEPVRAELTDRERATEPRARRRKGAMAERWTRDGRSEARVEAGAERMQQRAGAKLGTPNGLEGADLVILKSLSAHARRRVAQN